jgi:hypothetical protein
MRAYARGLKVGFTADSRDWPTCCLHIRVSVHCEDERFQTLTVLKQNTFSIMEKDAKRQRNVLVVLNKGNRVDGPLLHDRPVPDGAQVVLVSAVAGLLEVIMQRCVEDAELRPKPVKIHLEIRNRVLPEFAHREHLGLIRLCAHALDKVGDKAAVDVL